MNFTIKEEKWQGISLPLFYGMKRRPGEKIEIIIFHLLLVVTAAVESEFRVLGISEVVLLSFILVVLHVGLTPARGITGLKEKNVCDWCVVILLALTLSNLINGLFPSARTLYLNLEYTVITILFCVLYFIFKGKNYRELRWKDVLLYVGGGVSFLYILYAMGVEQITPWINMVVGSRDIFAAHLMPLVVVSLFSYCKSDTVYESVKSFIVTGLCFLSLHINQNQLSVWIVFFLFLTIPCMDILSGSFMVKLYIMFWLFIFTLNTLNLLYVITDWFPGKIIYSIHYGFVVESILVGAGIFLLWKVDQYYRNIRRFKESILLFQNILKKVLLYIFILFCGLLMNGNLWHGLQDERLTGFVKMIAVNLENELRGGNSTIYQWIYSQGLLSALILLLIFTLLGLKIHGRFKKREIGMEEYIIYVLFLVSILLWDVPSGMFLCSCIIIFYASVGNDQKIQSKIERE